jgi:hypothetical protein
LIHICFVPWQLLGGRQTFSSVQNVPNLDHMKPLSCKPEVSSVAIAGRPEPRLLIRLLLSTWARYWQENGQS